MIYLKKVNYLWMILVVSENAWRLSQSGYSSMFIMVNDQVSVEDLLRGIIIASGNDACIVLQRVLLVLKKILQR